MRYCRYCGGEVSDTAKACGRCGRWLETESVAPPSADGPTEAEHVEPERDEPPLAEPVPPEPEGLKTLPPAAPPEMDQVQPGGATAPVEVAPPETTEARTEPIAVSAPEVPAFAGEPKRRIPIWVWGLGALVIVLVAGAVLAMSGAIGLPGQQATGAAATDTTGSAARPAETPAPEPVTVRLGREAASETVRAGQPVIVEWLWGVCDPELLDENIFALDFKVTVDGEVVALGKMARYRTEVREEEHGVHGWWQYYAYSLGSFRSGSSHWVELERGFSQQVTDGCDVDGNGSLDWYGPDSTFVSSLHLTVR
jgi:hypothetical protein